MGGIGVLGAGAWGTALAETLAQSGMDVTLYARDIAVAHDISAHHQNSARLPGIVLHQSLQATDDLKQAIAGKSAVLAVVPAQGLRSLAGQISGLVSPGVPIIICAKGIERSTGLFMSEVLAQCLPGNPAAVLSGPSFAADVARGLPTALTLAAHDGVLAEHLANQLGNARFRLYHSNDIRGVEIGGAAKNVLAIACGIATGRGLGASAGAALVARGFAELMRFGRAFGARSETLSGLSGLGDLVLTCGSAQSRNFAYGEAIGREGRVTETIGYLAEGAFTASALLAKAHEHGVDMPICRCVEAILGGQMDVDAGIDVLLGRPMRAEG